MATVFGQPGAGAAKKGLLYIAGPPLIVLGVFGLVSPLIVWGLGRSGLLGWFFAFAVAGYFIRKDLDTWREMGAMIREGGNWLRGARGEQLVHAALDGLPAEYAVFHDCNPIGPDGRAVRWNVDHVVIGPSGVFVIETKRYRRTRVPRATPGSFQAKNVAQTRRNATDLKEKLRAWSGGQLEGLFVVPVLVYAQENAFVENVHEGDVRVIPLKWLKGEIEMHYEAHIDMDKAGRIVGVLFRQMAPDLQNAFRIELEAYGQLSRQARYDIRDAAIAAKAAETTPPTSSLDRPEICPRCGGRLVRKTAQTGVRKGKDFLGCENYRDRAKKCGYLFNLD